MSATASAVKALRDRTGAGLMDCKTALVESGGDMDAASDYLRKKGIVKAEKKSSRATGEGVIGVASSDDGKSAALVEINSETDFVARNSTFSDFASLAARSALDVGGDFESLRSVTDSDGLSLESRLSSLVGVLGENLSLRRSAGISVSDGVVGTYVHAQSSPGLGRIGVAVGLETSSRGDAISLLAKQLAMHVAASSPLAATESDLDPHATAKEREILAAQARESAPDKPEGVIEKMIEGRMRKFMKDSVLTSQEFVMDSSMSVGEAISLVEKASGASIVVGSFVRFALGEDVGSS